MKAMRLLRFGGPEELRLEDVTPPVPGAGDVLIQVHAAGLNYSELPLRAGRLPGAPPPPFVPGFEAAGVVREVGQEVTHLKPGARVVAMLPGQGTFAELAVAPAALVTPIPDALPFEKAVALLSQAPAALAGLRVAGQLKKGEAVFIPAAAGGVGSFMVQLAKALGAGRVIAGASTEEKRALARRLGADVVLDYTRPDWPERVREATDGRGADVVFERDGGDALGQSLRALAPQGRLVVFGVDSMFGTSLRAEQVTQLLFQNQRFVGFSFPALPPEVQAEVLREVFERVMAGTLEVVVERTFGLHELPEAHRALEQRKTSGKVVILPGEAAHGGT
ncbi:NADPH:quinone oxidoreductase family protein [Pyxidicoccus fallax]|uniref:NADPH:quinone oxidoreductase family protein n=1 Tax=Pyxidicoccus fallax TaxID=394095 RepID=A0A848LJG9_9BACT|nr:NADPH:quinone oxidoreductase family protein [Pyxidicoccus fallax]NMO17860.1 NADPH:quinone oxidoreductase family protein [Pyxidicoccus fallax]NPC81392.1 NADPH:quinone oxidoreductase family protein [Pyxidicoccus fallax]